MEKHKHEHAWETRPGVGKRKPYLACTVCGKKKTLAFKRRGFGK